jgi:hypothetical protein
MGDSVGFASGVKKVNDLWLCCIQAARIAKCVAEEI